MKARVFITGLLITTFISCGRFAEQESYFDNAVYLDVAAVKADQNLTVKKTLTELECKVVVTLAYPSDDDIKVSLAVDPYLVEDYNALHGTSYPALTADHYALSTESVVIDAGRTMSEEISLKISGLESLEIDATYIVPLTIVSSDIRLLKASSTAWYVLKRSSAITSAASLRNNWITFPTLDKAGPHSDLYNGLDALTYEAFIKMDNFTAHKDISTVMGVEQYCLLRIGDASFPRQQLQFDGSGVGFEKFPVKDESKILSAGVWYHVAATYNRLSGEVCIFVNGKLQSRTMGLVSPNPINLAMRAMYDGDNTKYATLSNAYQFFVGKSYDDTRQLYGDVAEVRVWSVARTPQQIWDNMYEVDPQSEGLIGYWKCNEDVGNILIDATGNGNDGVAAFSMVWPNDIEIPFYNKNE